jgi:hypothetical protein
MNSQPYDAESARRPDQPRSPRPYRTPTLTEYGSVAKLTQGTASRLGDQGGGGFRSCL